MVIETEQKEKQHSSTAGIELLPGAQVGVGDLVQHAAEVVLRQRLLRHLLQLFLPLQGQTVILQLNALWRSPQTLGQAGLLQAIDFRH